MLKCADCYISSSTLEGLPISVLEAMYCGLPCILSDIPQHKEIAYKGNIILPFDEKQWTDEINRIARLSPLDRMNRSLEMRDYTIENFSLVKMHTEYDKIYQEM